MKIILPFFKVILTLIKIVRMKNIHFTFLLISLLIISLPVFCQDIMPPALPWEGKSKEILVNQSNTWITPFEKSDGTESPTYAETMAWLEKLANELHTSP